MLKLINDLTKIVRKDKKTRVFVINASGGPNFGDETIMEILVSELYAIDKDIEIVSIRKPKTYIKVKYGKALVKIFQSKSSLFREIASMIGLLKADYVIMGGGGLIQDYGLENILKQQIEVRLRLLRIARFLGKKVILLGIGAGPIETKRGKVLVRKILNKVQLITTRDKESAHLLKKLGVKTKVLALADFVFAKETSTNETTVRINKITNTEDLKVGVSLLPLYSIINRQDKINIDEKAVKEIVEVLKHLVKKYNAQIYLIPMDLFQDEPFLIRIKSMVVSPNIIISKVKSTGDIATLYSKMDIVIGSRFHSIVFSIISQIPFVAIRYHPKVRSISKLFTDFDISIQYDDLKTDILINKIEWVLRNKKRVKRQLQTIYPSLKDKAEENFRVLKNFMG